MLSDKSRQWSPKMQDRKLSWARKLNISKLRKNQAHGYILKHWMQIQASYKMVKLYHCAWKASSSILHVLERRWSNPWLRIGSLFMNIKPCRENKIIIEFRGKTTTSCIWFYCICSKGWKKNIFIYVWNISCLEH